MTRLPVQLWPQAKIDAALNSAAPRLILNTGHIQPTVPERRICIQAGVLEFQQRIGTTFLLVQPRTFQIGAELASSDFLAGGRLEGEKSVTALADVEVAAIAEPAASYLSLAPREKPLPAGMATP